MTRSTAVITDDTLLAAIPGQAHLACMDTKTLKRTLATVCSVMMVIALGGWLTMWFTEQMIWSGEATKCNTLAVIELKSHVYKACNYVVNRYRGGEWAFTISCRLLVVPILAGWILERKGRARSYIDVNRPFDDS
jgi:hypothetical protein